jgi:predicted NUDIX family phosphoesterase
MSLQENVLVLSEADLAGLLETNFASERAEKIQALANQRGTFLVRSNAEENERFKQIIPYVMICHQDQHLLLKRSSKQTEARLHNKLSLGIGGHINDLETRAGHTDLVHGGMLRELNEEIRLDGEWSAKPVGVIYDPSTAVGRVHLGIVFRVDCASANFVLNEPELMSGEWVSRDALADLQPHMETWSQLLVQSLLQETAK